MSLRIRKSTKKRHIDEIDREPNKKIFIVCEGEKTEIIYFEGIKNNAKELGINNLIEIIIMDKDKESRGISDANGLIHLARKAIEDFSSDGQAISNDTKYEHRDLGTYDKARDRFLIVLDRD